MLRRHLKYCAPLFDPDVAPPPSARHEFARRADRASVRYRRPQKCQARSSSKIHRPTRRCRSRCLLVWQWRCWGAHRSRRPPNRNPIWSRHRVPHGDLELPRAFDPGGISRHSLRVFRESRCPIRLPELFPGEATLFRLLRLRVCAPAMTTPLPAR